MKVWVITWKSESCDEGILGVQFARPTKESLVRDAWEYLSEHFDHLEEDELDFDFEDDEDIATLVIDGALYIRCEEHFVAL